MPSARAILAIAAFTLVALTGTAHASPTPPSAERTVADSPSGMVAKTRKPICTAKRRRGCIKRPRGVGRPHRNQNALSGPKLDPAVIVDPDGLGAAGIREQGAVDWAFSMRGNQSYNGWCGKFVAHAFNRAALGYASAWAAARAFGLRGGAAPAGALVFFKPHPTNGGYGHVGIALPGNKMISAQNNGVQVGDLNSAYWRSLYAGWTDAPASWPGRPPTGAGPQFVGSAPAAQAPAPPPAAPAPPAVPAPAPAPAPGVDRQSITSYNRMAPGAPRHGFFHNAWQPFVAQSNTITHIGVAVGSPGAPAGQTIDGTIAVRLCASQPDNAGNCAKIIEGNPRITNYGNTYADFGDIAVTPGQTYWVEWFQPAPVNGSTWVTYWWAGGSTITASDQMQMVVRGYNR